MDKINCPFCKIRREKFTLKEIASDHDDFIIVSFKMISLVVKIAIIPKCNWRFFNSAAFQFFLFFLFGSP